MDKPTVNEVLQAMETVVRFQKEGVSSMNAALETMDTRIERLEEEVEEAEKRLDEARAVRGFVVTLKSQFALASCTPKFKVLEETDPAAATRLTAAITAINNIARKGPVPDDSGEEHILWHSFRWRLLS